MKKPRRTAKQKEIMSIILTSAGEGVLLTSQEIHDRVSYRDECTHGAIRVSLRYLEELGMIERVRDGKTVRVHPTEKGYDWFRIRRR